ncbi:FkbM family methyltransferase [Mesoflavibacter zeaxanthinifaciens]|uniref:FkbM family methyltransferase n=1 Tax=Mesoflavibacter zeaxanthinifaciens TaxID=393060 RepID=UPI003A91B108
MKFKKWLSSIYHSIKKEGNTLKTSTLCGVPLKTYNQTIPATPDQDDTWFFLLAKNHNVIFDIGANVGFTALLAMIQNPNREYVLVDPNPLALQKAQGNLLNNNLGFKAQYYSAFVSDKSNEMVKFYTLGTGAAGSMHSTHAVSAATVNSFINVSTVTLDFLYSYYNLKPDLVKIDVEGAETLVIEGATTLAEQTKCTFFVEMHNLKNLPMEKAAEKMIAWSKKIGYKVWYLKTGEELTNGEPVKMRGRCHLLLLPKEKAYFSYLKGIEQNAPLPKTLF